MYDAETYDYPSAIQESIAELSTSIGANITNFAATNLKGTALPAPAPVTPAAAQHKTLPHALGRAATQASTALAEGGEGESKFGKAVGLYASTWEKIAHARVEHDEHIKMGFLAPWQVGFKTRDKGTAANQCVGDPHHIYRGGHEGPPGRPGQPVGA